MQKKSNYNSPHFFKHKLIFYILKQNLCNFRYFQEIPRQRLAIYSQTWCKWQKHEKFHQIINKKKQLRRNGSFDLYQKLIQHNTHTHLNTFQFQQNR